MIQTNRPLPPPPPSSSSKTIMPPARGTKTLAWFMDQTDLLKGQQQQQMAAQQQGQGGVPQPIGTGRRGSSSDESKSTTPSSTQQQHHQLYPQYQNPSLLSSSSHQQQLSSSQQQNQQKKQKKYRKTLSGHGALRKDGFHAGGHAMSESSEEGSTTVTPQTTLPATSGGVGAGPGIGGGASEEYWFYDVATDGYYYEQNGAKGWRRRQPNAAVHKGNAKDQEVAHMNVNGPSKYNHLLAAQAAAAAQAAFFQQAFQLQQAAALNPPTSTTPNGGATSGASGAVQPTMRYYDPTSDGFFYEMASVDGWKRRQPNKPVSASVPNGVTRPYSQRQAAQTTVTGGGAPSYGAALARGQFPRNTVKQPEPCTTPADSRDSASSSQCGDTFELFSSNDPIFNPIQRPSALNLEQKAVGGAQQPPPPAASTVALFEAVLADFNGGVKPTTYADLLPTPATGAAPTTQSPMKESWNSFRSCSLFSPIKPSSKRVPTTVGGGGVASNQPMGGAATMLDEMDDDTMRMLLKDLDKLWANTPVSGLNQA